MNFLCILQVSRIVFVLKTKFYNHFSVFIILWTGRQFLGNSGVTVQTLLRLRTLPRWTAGYLRKSAGALYEDCHGEGVRWGLDHPITRGW
jgi:hypothetical protein